MDLDWLWNINPLDIRLGFASSGMGLYSDSRLKSIVQLTKGGSRPPSMTKGGSRPSTMTKGGSRPSTMTKGGFRPRTMTKGGSRPSDCLKSMAWFGEADVETEIRISNRSHTPSAGIVLPRSRTSELAERQFNFAIELVQN